MYRISLRSGKPLWAARPKWASFMKPIRVMIADDHALVRESIKAILSSEEDMEIIAVAEDGKQAIELSVVHQPDVVVMDISMPKLDGIRSTRLIRSDAPGTSVVILSMHVNATLVQQAIKMGAKGYVLKGRAADELAPAVRAAKQGRLYISADIPPTYLPRERD